MPKIKLTNSSINKLKTEKTGNTIYWDTELRGFCLWVGARAMTFYAQRDMNGKTVKVKLGRYGEITAEQARRDAMGILHKMQLGTNPNEEARRLQAQGITLEEAYETFKWAKKRSSTTLKDYDRCMNIALHDWLKRPLKEITREMVLKRHKRLGEERGTSWANLVMRVLRAVFNYSDGIYEELEIRNPVNALSQTKTWHKVNRRQTYIAASQMENWYTAVKQLPSAIGRDYLRFVWLTGLRLQEAASLPWKNVDFSNRIFTVERTKNNKPLVLPLSDFLYDLLLNRKQMSEQPGYEFSDSPFVFPGPGKTSHLVEPKSFVKTVKELTGIVFSVHDLRRTFITTANKLGTGGYTIKNLVNHSYSDDVTAGYIVRNIDDLREPMQKITDELLKQAGVIKSGNIIQFPRNTN